MVYAETKQEKSLANYFITSVDFGNYGSILCFKFLYLPNEFDEGVNDDPRFMVWYWDYDNYIYKNGDTLMTFRLRSPKNVDENKSYPLAIFLHGGGSHGMDNTKSMCGFYVDNLKKYAPEDCYVLVPQVGDEECGWDVNMIETLEKCLDEFVFPEHKVNKERVYLSGSSMGGIGSIQALVHSPNRYAALMFDAGAIPYKEGLEEEIEINYNEIKNVPMFISHGRNDKSMLIDNIIRFTDELKIAGAMDVALQIYEDRGHETTDLFYTDKAHWDWMFKQTRTAAV